MNFERVKLPPNTWERAIHEIAEGQGGIFQLRDLNEKIGKYIKLTPKHLRPLKSASDRPAYVNEARAFVGKMHKEGKLRRVARGTYKIV